MNFISICNKHQLTVLETIQYISDYKPNDAVELCSLLSGSHGIQLTVKQAKFLLDNVGNYCASCGYRFHKEDINGGRCTQCLSSISSLTLKK